MVEYDLILDDDQFSTVKTFGSERDNARRLRMRGRRRNKRKAVRHSIYHWPGAIVPYQIHSSVGKDETIPSGDFE